MESTAVRLKRIMSIRGLKQCDLVNATGIPKSTLNDYLSGRMKPKQDKLTKLSRALNVTEVWLMGYDVEIGNNAIDSFIDSNIEFLLLYKDLTEEQKSLVYGMVLQFSNANKRKK